MCPLDIFCPVFWTPCIAATAMAEVNNATPPLATRDLSFEIKAGMLAGRNLKWRGGGAKSYTPSQ